MESISSFRIHVSRPLDQYFYEDFYVKDWCVALKIVALIACQKANFPLCPSSLLRMSSF